MAKPTEEDRQKAWVVAVSIANWRGATFRDIVADRLAHFRADAKADVWKQAIEIAKARESKFDGADSVVIDLEAAAGDKE